MTRFFNSLTPARKIILSFALVILVGSLLLSLPIAQITTSKAHYLDHLFTTLSMVCVTGLSTMAVAETYNTLGQTICLFLIQIGGLSLLTLIGLIAIQTGQRLSFKDRSTLQESLVTSETLDIKAFVRSVAAFTFGLEGIGSILLSLIFVPQLGWFKGLFTAVFTAVSAFCNAGFDNLGSSSLIAYQTHWLMNLTISFLIITGGLGFSVWFDLQKNLLKGNFSFKHLRFHTKVVLGLTAIILGLGTLLSLLTEYNNPDTIGPLSLGHKILVSFFQTVTMRTAGFATINYTQARPITLLLYIFQMMLGGAPGGTAGGLKITNFLVVILFVKASLRDDSHVNFRHHSFANSTLRKAFLAFFIFTGTFLAGLSALAITAPQVPFLHLIYETMSALATVGVTTSLTPSLGSASHIIIMALMFFGRVGPTTVLVSLTQAKKTNIKYAKSTIIVG